MSFSTKKYYFTIVCVITVLFSCKNNNKQIDTKTIENLQDTIIIDCNYSFEQATAGANAPKKIIGQLSLIDVTYFSVDNKLHQGQILVNQKIAEDILQIFEFIKEQKFPVKSVVPIVKYGWSDELSMEDNNTSAFCYRNVNFSFHAQGMAIDINPRQNPAVYKFIKRIEPKNGIYNIENDGTLSKNHPVVLKFKELGFRWGGDFSQKYDYQHFEKGTSKVRQEKKIEE